MTESCKHTNAAYLCVWMSAYVTVHLLGLILLAFPYTVHFYKETKVAMLRETLATLFKIQVFLFNLE